MLTNTCTGGVLSISPSSPECKNCYKHPCSTAMLHLGAASLCQGVDGQQNCSSAPQQICSSAPQQSCLQCIRHIAED